MKLTEQVITNRVLAYEAHQTLHPSALEVTAYRQALQWAATYIEAPEGEVLRFTINGRPMSTTNSQRIVSVPIKGTGRHRSMVLKSKAAVDWKAAAIMQIRGQRKGRATIEGPVIVEMDIFRAVNAGDADNYIKGCQDALQASGVIRNDSQVKRVIAEKFTDRVNPRYEVRVIVIPGQEVLIPLDEDERGPNTKRRQPVRKVAEPDPMPDAFKTPEEREKG